MKPLPYNYLWLGLGLATMATSGCTTNEQALVLKPVGPVVTIQRHAVPGGFLVVYTPIVEPKIFPDTMFAPHTGYEILDRQGNVVRTVRNHLGAWDETPDMVSLAPGKYTVKAESETGNPLVVPVIIKAGRTTSVNLEWREPTIVAKQ
jgi:hypothetical protein